MIASVKNFIKRVSKRAQVKIPVSLSVMSKLTVVILHQNVPDDAAPDEMDVLNEAAHVAGALERLGYTAINLPVTLAVDDMVAAIERIKPEVVFNLVETIANAGYLSTIPLMALDHLKIKYCGNHTNAMFQTSNKILAKKILDSNGLPTPSWQLIEDVKNNGLRLEYPVIIKPINEDASIDIDDDSIYYNKQSFLNRMKTISPSRLRSYFVEQFIDGREVNISLLANEAEPTVLPPAEIKFLEYPAGKPAIVTYSAKWNEQSFEYTHTPRTFTFDVNDEPMLQNIQALSRRCWTLFELCGYARVDFRIDAQNRPWILEINSNPCISADSGFFAAAMQAGLSIDNVVERIINDAY